MAAVLVVGCAIMWIISTSVFIYLLLDFNHRLLPLLPPISSFPCSIMQDELSVVMHFVLMY